MNNMAIFGQMAQMMQGGMNPQQLMQRMIGKNPQAGQAMNVMQMLRGRSVPEQLQIAQRVAQERGFDLRQVMQQFGVRI